MIEDEEKQQDSQDGGSDKIGLLASACSAFAEIPPELKGIAKGNEALGFLADTLHAIFSGSDELTLPGKAKKDIEFAFRTFAFQASASVSGESIDEREQANQVRQLAQQLSESKEETRKLEERLSKQEKEKSQLQAKLEASQQEAKTYFAKLNQNDEKVTKLRRENTAAQQQLKAEIETIQEEKQALRDKLKVIEFTVTRLSKSLDIANEDNAQISAELVSLKSKAEAKRQRLKESQSNATKIQLRMQELDADNQRLITEQNDLIQHLKECQEELIANGPENLSNLEAERDSYKETVFNLQKQLDEQTNDLLNTRRDHTEIVKSLHQKDQRIQEQEDEIEKLTEERNNYQQRVEEQSKQIEEKDQQLAEVQTNNSTFVNSSVFETLNDETKTRVESRFGKVTQDQMPELLNDLLEGTTNDELMEHNKKLVCIIENELRFLSSTIVRGIIDPKLLSPDTQSNPLNEDQSARDRMFVEIARTRQFIQTNCAGDHQVISEQEIQNTVAQLQDGLNLQQREASALIALQATNNDVIRRFCEKTLSQNQTIVSQLCSVSEIVGSKGQPEQIVTDVVEFLRNYQQFSKKAKIILDAEYDYTNYKESFEFLSKYLQTSSQLLRDIDNDLRPVIQFDGELLDLPAFAITCYNDLKNIISKSQEESVASVRSQVAALRREIASEQEKASEQVAQLEEDNRQKGETISTMQAQMTEASKREKELQQQNTTLESEKQEIEEKLQAILNNYGNVENDLEEARAETEQMREQMNSKQKMYEERLDNLIKDERKLHADDLLHFEEKLKAREDRLRLEINTKGQKLAQMKAKLKEVIVSYDVAFKQQKEATAQLRQQNNDLIDRLQRTTSPKKQQKISQGASSTEVERLRADVRRLQQEKAILESQLEEAIVNSEAQKNTCDHYWQQQILEKETKSRQVIQEEQSKQNNQQKQFLANVIQSLSPYVPKDANPEAVLQFAQEISKKLSTAEQELVNLKQQKLILQPPSSSNAERTEQLSNIVQEWDRWARDLYVNVTDGQIAKQSTKELRYALGEMVLSSIGHRKLIWRLESLRSQKKALTLSIEIPGKSTPPITARATLLSVVSALRIMRKAGRFQSVFN